MGMRSARRVAALTLGLLLAAALALPAAGADMPYESYVYDSDGGPLLIPAPFRTEAVLRGEDLDLGGFSDITDLFFDGERLYVCDAGNRRVVILDEALETGAVLDAFDNNGAPDGFDRPGGVYAADGLLYVTDVNRARILVFDARTLELRRELPRPAIPVLAADYAYKPLKVAADASGHVYVIAEGINQGLIELDETGAFSTFLGAPGVVPDVFELIWRQFATREQIAQLTKFVPTEYDSLFIDEDGFIFAVSKNTEDTAFVKLNSQGIDVLNLPQALGDSGFYDEKPYFVDMVVDPEGIYYLLDSKQGKIYAYTREGDFLFAFGANAAQKGGFHSAAAMVKIGERLVVADSAKNTITILARTAFGADVDEAAKLQVQGRYDAVTPLWESVARQCSHYPLAEVGIAQAEIDRGAYTGAMARLRALRETEVYETAFEKWREGFVRDNLLWLVLAVAALAAGAAILVPRVRRRPAVQRLRARPAAEKWRYATYVALHPFDGFWDLKRERRGDMRTALSLLAVFVVCYAVRAQYSGYMITGTAGGDVNVLFECLTMLLPLGFYVVANWCFTTLMDGEGSMKDVVIATCYALKPYILFSLPMFLLSHALTADEAIFYVTAETVCWIWIFGLLFFGMMITHDYTLGKAVGALICTLIGICLIVFVGLLFINVVQDVVVLVTGLYDELSFRFY